MDEETKINLLLTSYSLEDLLEDNGITEEFVVDLLVRRGFIDLEDYFETEDEG